MTAWSTSGWPRPARCAASRWRTPLPTRPPSRPVTGSGATPRVPRWSATTCRRSRTGPAGRTASSGSCAGSTRPSDDALCCLRRRLCRTGLGDEGAAGALLEIVSTLRNRYLEATYGQCRRPQGVLLARAWLGRDENGRCVVDCIDSYPPFRRVIAPPGWPDLPGHVNVAGLWWQRRAIACGRVPQLGLRVSWRPVPPPAQRGRTRWIPRRRFRLRACDAEYEAWLYRDRCGHWDGDEPDGRVVRLRPAAAQVGTPPPVPRARASRTPAPRATRGRSAARRDNQ